MIDINKKNGFVRFICLILSVIFRCVIFLRNFAFDIGILKTYRPSVPVISVGNIVAGGTGKTPLTMLLTSIFKDRYKIAVVSRGYGVKIKKSKLVKPGDDPKTCGDEAVLFMCNFPDVLYFVGPNRCCSAKMAEQHGANLIIMDDGFQHRYLERDCNIVVLDGNDPWGGGYLLPRGLLREPPKSLQRADIIVINHTDDPNVLGEISKPVVCTNVEVKDVLLLSGEKISLQGKRVALFCGIGKPENFVETVKNLGAEIVKTCFLQDHASISKEKLSKILEESKAELLLCTEKDMIKITNYTDLPISYVKIGLKVTFGANILRKIF